METCFADRDSVRRAYQGSRKASMQFCHSRHGSVGDGHSLFGSLSGVD